MHEMESYNIIIYDTEQVANTRNNKVILDNVYNDGIYTTHYIRENIDDIFNKFRNDDSTGIYQLKRISSALLAYMD